MGTIAVAIAVAIAVTGIGTGIGTGSNRLLALLRKALWVTMSLCQRPEFCLFGIELAAESSGPTLISSRLVYIGTYSSDFSSLLLSYEAFVC